MTLFGSIRAIECKSNRNQNFKFPDHSFDSRARQSKSKFLENALFCLFRFSAAVSSISCVWEASVTLCSSKELPWEDLFEFSSVCSLLLFSLPARRLPFPRTKHLVEKWISLRFFLTALFWGTISSQTPLPTSGNVQMFFVSEDNKVL